MIFFLIRFFLSSLDSEMRRDENVCMYIKKMIYNRIRNIFSFYNKYLELD